MNAVCGEALVLGATPFGEHDALVHLLSPEHGRLRGLVKRGRHQTAALQPFNTVQFEHYRRLPHQLGTLKVDLTVSRAPLWMGSGAGSYVCAYLADLLTVLLPEEQAMDGLAEAVLELVTRLPERGARAADGWERVVRFELFLLDVLGYGLRLHDPVLACDGDVLAYVSPRSGRSVGRAAAVGFEERLLPLPALLGGPLPPAPAADCAACFGLTGAFLAKALPPTPVRDTLLARGRLTAYYARVLQQEVPDHAPSIYQPSAA